MKEIKPWKIILNELCDEEYSKQPKNNLFHPLTSQDSIKVVQNKKKGEWEWFKESFEFYKKIEKKIELKEEDFENTPLYSYEKGNKGIKNFEESNYLIPCSIEKRNPKKAPLEEWKKVTLSIQNLHSFKKNDKYKTKYILEDLKKKEEEEYKKKFKFNKNNFTNSQNRWIEEEDFELSKFIEYKFKSTSKITDYRIRCALNMQNF